MPDAEPIPQPPTRGPSASLATLAVERLGRHGPQPFLTYYDDATGERTELSYATFDNWVSKTANLLCEELDAAPGDRVGVALDGHWTAPVVLFACWRAGVAAVRLTEDVPAPRPAMIALFRHEDIPSSHAAAGPLDVVTLSVGDGMAGRLHRPSDDDAYAEMVLACPDDYDDPGVEPDSTAVLLPATTGWLQWSHANLLAAAEAFAAWGLSPRDRLLLATGLEHASSMVLAVAAFAVGGSAVATRRFSPGTFWARVRDERVTWAAVHDSQLRSVLDAAPAVRSPDLRGFLVPTGTSAEMVARVRSELGLTACAGDDLPQATYGASLVPADIDDATVRWLAAQQGRPAGVPTTQAEVGLSEGALTVRGPVVTAQSGTSAGVGERWLHTGRPARVVEGPDGRRHVFLLDG